MCPKLPDAAHKALAMHVSGIQPRDDRSPPRRIRLWERADQVHCSVVGTCASVDDIRRIASKVGMRIDPDAADYAVHGHLVMACTTDTPFARAFQKAMDRRYEGMLRRVARIRDPGSLRALWIEMRDKGQIAAAYWALMTHGHVPSSLQNVIFGEVHMLSHLAGASYRRRAVQAVVLQDQLQETEERARRVEAGLRDALAERDAEIERLRERLTAQRDQQAANADSAAGPASGGKNKALRRLAKLERALVVARYRAREAEGRCEELEIRLQQAAEGQSADGTVKTRPSPAPGRAPVIAGSAILYLGGRSGHIDRLRTIAAEYDASLIHHDGGLEDAVRRIDSLLPTVDCVLCPVSCVSHDACLRAKRTCQKLGKPFLPLKSASQAALRAALEQLSEPDGGLS